MSRLSAHIDIHLIRIRNVVVGFPRLRRIVDSLKAAMQNLNPMP